MAEKYTDIDDDLQQGLDDTRDLVSTVSGALNRPKEDPAEQEKVDKPDTSGNTQNTASGAENKTDGEAFGSSHNGRQGSLNSATQPSQASSQGATASAGKGTAAASSNTASGGGGTAGTGSATGTTGEAGVGTESGMSATDTLTTTATDGDGIAIVVLILALIIIACMVSQLPQDAVFTEGVPETSRAEKEEKLSEAYVKMKMDSRAQIIDTLDEEFDCGASFFDKSALINGMKTVKEGEAEADSFKFVTEAPSASGESHNACNITIKFSPDISEMTDNITAYTSSVDSTIGYFNTTFINKYIKDPDKYIHEDADAESEVEIDTRLLEEMLSSKEFQDEMEKVMKQVEGTDFLRYNPKDDTYAFTDSAKKLFKGIDGAQTDAGGDDAIDLIAKDSDTYFELDLEPERWKGMDEVKKTKKTKDIKVAKDIPVYDESGQITGYKQVEEVVDTIEYKEVEATVTLPIYYGLLQYRKEDVDDLLEKIIGQPYCKYAEDDGAYHACDFEQSAELIYNTMSEYYSMYQAEYNGNVYEQEGKELKDDEFDDITGSQNIQILDNRKEIFAPLLEKYPEISIPIYGLEMTQRKILMAGILAPSYSGSIAPASELYELLNSSDVWAHVKSLLDAGIIHGDYPYQCTTFALAWLHDHYGMTDLYAKDGASMAASLVGKNGMTYLAGPAPGAVVSLNAVEGNPFGHVLIIESVDAAADRIVVVEGNYNASRYTRGTSNAPVVRQTYTFEQWNARIHLRNPIYVGMPE